MDDTRDPLTEAQRQLDARTRALELAERRLAEARADARALAAHNERLNATLREVRASVVELRAQLDGLASPPAAFATVVGHTEDGTVDVEASGRRLRVAVAAELVAAPLDVGAWVLLNESQVVVGVVERPSSGELVRVRERVGDDAVLVTTGSDEEVVLQLAPALRAVALGAGDTLLAERRALVALARVDRTEVEELTLDEVPDVAYSDIGGLEAQIEEIRDAVELPFRHRELFVEFGLAAPKGVLLYGPPGCGKTMIAKAVANAAGSSFLNVKGPELLNKYVGETERQVRLVFSRARELAADGRPVVVFFDEMDSLFRTRGSGVSSDVESTVVPQLLSEIDGVESLKNVIVIGATNREDLIDPAILRPGRLDVKIKLARPDEAGARHILAKHLRPDTPVNPAEAAASGGEAQFRAALVADAAAALYARTAENEFVEVTYAGGAKEVLHVADFVSGAMLANVVARAKKAAIKEVILGGERGLRREHVLRACAEEVAENEELPNTTNPDDWARVSGRRGERIVYLRTLHRSRSLPVE